MHSSLFWAFLHWNSWKQFTCAHTFICMYTSPCLSSSRCISFLFAWFWPQIVYCQGNTQTLIPPTLQCRYYSLRLTHKHSAVQVDLQDLVLLFFPHSDYTLTRFSFFFHPSTESDWLKLIQFGSEMPGIFLIFENNILSFSSWSVDGEIQLIDRKILWHLIQFLPASDTWEGHRLFLLCRLLMNN